MNEAHKNLWERLRDFLGEITNHHPLSDMLRSPAEQKIAFTIAIIALSAKMAKADGQVTRDEVRTLRQIFEFNESDARDIGRVFDLARQDVAGYETYAKRIARLFAKQPEMLDHIFESLFLIALADNQFHENEEVFLEDVRQIFDLPKDSLERLKARYIINDACNPFQILGVPADASAEEIRQAYKTIIKDNHPDRLRAKGLPSETIALAENRVRAANRAYDMIGH